MRADKQAEASARPYLVTAVPFHDSHQFLDEETGFPFTSASLRLWYDPGSGENYASILVRGEGVIFCSVQVIRMEGPDGPAAASPPVTLGKIPPDGTNAAKPLALGQEVFTQRLVSPRNKAFAKGEIISAISPNDDRPSLPPPLTQYTFAW